MSFYPLGHDSEEVVRLKKQMELLFPQEFMTMVRSNDHFLDVGCGSGDIISLLPTEASYFGIDLKNVVRPIFLSKHNVEIIEGDFTSLKIDRKFSFLNLRLILWSVNDPIFILQKSIHLISEPLRFFIYEPDDSGLEFSTGLELIGELAKNWQDHVIASGKNPFIGSNLPDLLASCSVKEFHYKSIIYLREGKDLNLLKLAATNLVNIFSKYPDSDSLKEQALKQIDNISKDDWLKEKYCYAYKE